MAMVRFATTCDAKGCDKRSPEYTAWPVCRECMLDVCPDHMEPGTASEDERNRCLCKPCAAFDRADDIAERALNGGL